MIAGPVAVGYVLMVSTIHGGKSIAIIFTIAAIHSKSHRQQPLGVNLITAFQVSILEVAFRLGTAI